MRTREPQRRRDTRLVADADEEQPGTALDQRRRGGALHHAHPTLGIDGDVEQHVGRERVVDQANRPPFVALTDGPVQRGVLRRRQRLPERREHRLDAPHLLREWLQSDGLDSVVRPRFPGRLLGTPVLLRP